MMVARRGKGSPETRCAHKPVASGGVELASFTAGVPDVQTVLFVNAVGMSGSILESIAQWLAQAGLNLLTWELRGSPGPADARAVTLADHVADGLAVLSAHHVDRVHVAGWCTGAAIGAFLAGELAGRARTFTSIDGVYLFSGTPGAPLGDDIFDMCQRIAADESQAPAFYEAVRPRGNEESVLGLPGQPELASALTLPYRQGVPGLVSYAHGIRSVVGGYDPVAACACLRLPVLFSARRDDKIVSYADSVNAAQLVPGALLEIADQGGHYGLFADAKATRRAAEFMLMAGALLE